MPLFRHSEVTDRQAANAQADTSTNRAGWSAGRGSRSIGTTRDTVQTTAGGAQPIQPGARRY
jgi:hypothetical protein